MEPGPGREQLFQPPEMVRARLHSRPLCGCVPVQISPARDMALLHSDHPAELALTSSLAKTLFPSQKGHARGLGALGLHTILEGHSPSCKGAFPGVVVYSNSSPFGQGRAGEAFTARCARRRSRRQRREAQVPPHSLGMKCHTRVPAHVMGEKAGSKT